MPVVRRVEGRQVATAPLPAARRRAAETALSLGAGVEQERARTGLAVAGVGAAIAEPGLRLFARDQAARRREAEEVRRQADTLAVIAADNTLAAWVRDRVHDPEQGALTIKGKDALPLPEQLGQEFTTLASQVEASLTTPEQRVGFARARANRQEALDLELRRHVAREIQTYTANELKARVDNALQLTIANGADPAAANRELVAGEQAIRALGQSVGLGPEAVEQQVRALQSEAVVGIISKLLAEGQTMQARSYFEETRDQIAGDKLDDVQRALRAGTVRQQAQQEADRIVGAGGTLTQQREQAKALEDPDVREEALRYIEHEAAVRGAIEQQQHEARLRGAYDVLDRAPDVRQVPGDLWSSLTGSERAALFEYAKDRAAGVPVETEWRTYYELQQQASNQPETFAQVNLYSYRHKLGDPEFKKLTDLQGDIKKGDREKADAFLDAGFRSEDALIKDALGALGIRVEGVTPTSREGQAIIELRRTFERQLGAFTSTTGKKPTQADQQQILDNILQHIATPGVERSFWFDTRGRIFAGLAGEDLPTAVGAIPPAERRLIEEALRGRGRAITDRAILDLYIDRRTGGGGR